MARNLLRGLAGLLVSTSAAALEFTLAPALNLGSSATNNVLFSERDTQSALSFDTGARVTVVAESARYRSSIAPSINLRRFAVGENLDADEYGVRSDHRWKVAEALTSTLKADYAQDSTLSSELTDAGRRNTVGNRNTLNLAPGLIYEYDALTQFNADFSHTDITTDTLASEGLADYTYKVASLGASRLLNSEMQVFVTGFINLFDVPSQQSSTVTYGAQTGLTWQWDSQTRLNLAGGYLTSTIDYLELLPALVFNPLPQIVLIEQPRSAVTGGPIASFSLSHDFEQARAEFRFSRQVSPTLRGSQSQEDGLELRISHDWTREIAVSVNARYAMVSAQADVVQNAANDLNRDTFNVTGAISWQVTREISLRGEYRYTTQENSFSQSVVNGHNLALTMNYQFERFFIGLW